MQSFCNRCPRIVLFDVDDVLWGLSERVAEHVGVHYSKLVDFHILENDLLTMKQRLAINEAYRTPQIFRNIEFFPGAERIFELESFGVLVQICSNSFSEEVRDLKLQQLLRLYPGISSEKLLLNIVNEKSTLRGKYSDSRIICSIDDSPYNVASSHAQHNLVPTAPWNVTDKAHNIMNVCYEHCAHGDVNSIIRRVITIIENSRRSLVNLPT